MWDSVQTLVTTDGLMPHGYCLLWRPSLLYLHVFSDIMTALAYYSIPGALIYFVLRRRNLRFRHIFVLFGAFILACGTTHLMGAWTIWQPIYGVQGGVKLLTALVSMATAIVLWPLIPQALALPSPEELEETNRRLINEIQERKAAEEKIRHLNANLEERVAQRTQELMQLNRQLELEIQERKRVEDSLRDADSRKDEFLAMLGHELRNPLAPIRNAVQVMRKISVPDPKLAWARDVVDRQTSHLTRLVDDLLDVSRIIRGKITLHNSSVDIAAVVEQALETSRPLIEARQHELTVSLPEESLRLQGDPVRLAQVVSNLLNNAAKYTPPGGRVGLTVTHEHGQAVIRVRDTGEGIPAHLLPKLFDLFTQAERTIDRSQGGLGIGLTIVQKLVELHGGYVEASSEGPGKGSEFVVRLPVSEGLASAKDFGESSSLASKSNRS
ncbi:HAMP domain-containing sensor histidine kinase [Methylocaldum sp.]|uniref:HAMP domain-containing sensor histidine kinase n=1 Tax=Methylocaldum sp. TaxID=1969727 RepID=UPI002D584689|nr:HAMP domain-containing sensor histidine kinase [Methylocaldum sp.]HYE35164.1 HAMP domain-containing sensor histidine kinase [Methylocaldum sp.]